MKKCNKCQHINRDNDLYCASCGSTLDEKLEEHKSIGENMPPLFRRIELFMEDGEFDKADTYCERLLDKEPENSQVYLYKLCVEFRCSSKNELTLITSDISRSKNYDKIIRFGTDEERAYINNIAKQINDKLQRRNQLEFSSDFPNTEEIIDEDYYVDVECQKCGEKLSFTSWQVTSGEPLHCPMCDSPVSITLPE